MQENTEIQALLKLIDDPDEMVYDAVSKKIISFGKDILPNLEYYWENSTNQALQEKIELLISQLHFEDVKAAFEKWEQLKKPDLLSGALILAKYVYPNVDSIPVFKEIEKLRRNVWLEMNSYLTPIEQINVLGSILYNYYKQTGIEINYNSTDGFLLNKILETRKGNAFGNGILVLIICHLLDVPVYAINIPNQFILAYFDEHYTMLNPTGHASEKIKFYIDPINGQMYSHRDVENYFKKIAVPPVSAHFKSLTNKAIVQTMLLQLIKCYETNMQPQKVTQLKILFEMIN